jgi:predicted nuclease with TOPRIM domain
MFCLKNLLYSDSYDKGIVLFCTHKSNYKEFIEYEESIHSVDNKLISSVNLTSKNVELNLLLDKEFILLEEKTNYDIVLKCVKLGTLTNKPTYKIMKVVISDESNDDIVEESFENEILDNYEINELYDNVRIELYEKIDEKKKQLENLIQDLDKKGTTLENLNFIAEINNSFHKFFGKKYI